MKNALAAGLVLAALTLAGCAAATDTKTTIPAATAELPTTAALTGTWKNVTTYPSTVTNPVAAEKTTTFTLTATTFLKQEVYVSTPTTGTPSTSYTDTKGTYSVSGDQCTLTTTDRRDSNKAFTDSTTGWTTQSPSSVFISTAILSGGKLYGLGGTVLMADGAVNGLLGTWTATAYYSTSSKPYNRSSITFSADTAVVKTFQSATATFTAIPDSTSTYGFSSTGSTFAVTTPAVAAVAATTTTPAVDAKPATSQTLSYLILGNYVVWANSADCGAYIKQ